MNRSLAYLFLLISLAPSAVFLWHHSDLPRFGDLHDDSLYYISAKSLADGGAIPTIVAHVRMRLARQISDSHTGPSGYIPLITVSPDWEGAFAEALTGPPDERQLAMAPSKLQAFMHGLRTAFDTAAATGEAPVLLTSGGIRMHVRAIVERIRPNTPVLAQAEISPRARIRTVGTI